MEGGPIHVLTGDYLAELTMLILLRSKLKDPDKGYASTFVRQCEEILATCMERGIRIVVNAGGLNPAGCALAIRDVGKRLGLDVQVAHVEGDDLMPRIGELKDKYGLANLDTKVPMAKANIAPVSANAYLGGAGIAAALSAGADVVITGRVTDAALVVGAAMWWHGWSRDAHDLLAGAIVAGHVIECGAQATGGNYSFFTVIEGLEHPGFPLVEIASDGSFVVTKHEGTGGAVTVGTVTAQLLYEIAGPRYVNPDAIALFDTISLEQVGPDRVAVSGVRGAAPPEDLKVCVNHLGGFRNRMDLVLTGLDIDAKASLVLRTLEARGFKSIESRLLRTDKPDAPSNEEAVAILRIEVRGNDPQKLGRPFSNAVTELALSSYPGFTMTAPPGDATPYGVYWPCLVPRFEVTERVVLQDGSVLEIDQPARTAPLESDVSELGSAPLLSEATTSVPLGTLVGARSGDKGGNANLGVWVASEEAFAWLDSWLDVDRFRNLLGVEVKDLKIERFRFPNLKALNFVIHGVLGEGVSSSSRPDPQAKGLGEYLRSRSVDVPNRLLSC